MENEIFKSLSNSAKERIRHPFLGSLIIAWICFNWKSILVLFLSDLPIEERINRIILVYSDLEYNLLYPLGTAIVLVIAMPYISLGFDYFLLTAKKIHRSRTYASKGDELDKSISIAKKEYNYERIKTGKKDLEDLNTQLAELKNTNLQAVSLQKAQEERLASKDSEISKLIKSASLDQETIEELRGSIKSLENKKADIEDKYSSTQNERYVYKEALSQLEIKNRYIEYASNYLIINQRENNVVYKSTIEELKSHYDLYIKNYKKFNKQIVSFLENSDELKELSTNYNLLSEQSINILSNLKLVYQKRVFDKRVTFLSSIGLAFKLFLLSRPRKNSELP